MLRIQIRMDPHSVECLGPDLDLDVQIALIFEIKSN
jgi:hypothetical protein